MEHGKQLSPEMVDRLQRPMRDPQEVFRETYLLDALREAERFMAYFAGETDGTFFVGPGTPQSCLAQIRDALAAR